MHSRWLARAGQARMIVVAWQRGVVMSLRRIDVDAAGRVERFVPGWWLLPGLAVSTAVWVGLFFLFAAR